MTTLGISVCAINRATESEGFQIFPAGEFRSVDGRPETAPAWEVKNPTALLKRIFAHKTDILVDYEHRTLLSTEDGLANPAAGWIKPADIEWAANGLFTRAVQWTPKAQGYIDTKEYRYLSPVFSYNKTTGEVLDLLHIALTNNPALDCLPGVIAAASRAFGDVPMTNPEILKALGLAPEADDAAVLKAIADLKSSNAEQTAQAELSRKNHDLLLKSINEVNSNVAALTRKTETSERQVLIAANARKLPESLKAWAESIDIATLTSFLASAPEIVPAGLQTENTPPKDDTKAELTHEEIAMCSRLGLTKEDYLKVKTNARA